MRAWQNIDNDVVTCKAGISGHRKGERILICRRYQVVDFASVGMNAASVVDEFRMLLKTCYTRKFEKNEKEKKQQQKPGRKERE